MEKNRLAGLLALSIATLLFLWAVRSSRASQTSPSASSADQAAPGASPRAGAPPAPFEPA